MSKKRYVIFGKVDATSERQNEINQSARLHYGEVDWMSVFHDEDVTNNYGTLLAKTLGDECNIALFSLASHAFLMSYCDSAYFPKDWEEDDELKMLHLLAFKYGIDIVYEPK